MLSEDHLLTVQDVYNVVTEHLNALDTLWPDSEQFGPRKIHIVELIDGIKLKLAAKAEKNATKYESPFEKAARKITGTTRDVTRPTTPREEAMGAAPNTGQSKSAMQLAHEAAQARMKK